MKKIQYFAIFLSFLLTVFLLSSIVSCQSDPHRRNIGIRVITQKQIDSTKTADSLYTELNKYIITKKNGFVIYTIDGHEYIYYTQRLYHSEGCPNTKHIR